MSSNFIPNINDRIKRDMDAKAAKVKGELKKNLKNFLLNFKKAYQAERHLHDLAPSELVLVQKLGSQQMNWFFDRRTLYVPNDQLMKAVEAVLKSYEDVPETFGHGDGLAQDAKEVSGLMICMDKLRKAFDNAVEAQKDLKVIVDRTTLENK